MILAENYSYFTIFVNFSQICQCFRKFSETGPLLSEFYIPKTHLYAEHIPVPSACYIAPGSFQKTPCYNKPCFFRKENEKGPHFAVCHLVKLLISCSLLGLANGPMETISHKSMR